MLKALPVKMNLQQQKAVLPELYEGFELLVEGAHPPEGVGEGFTLTFRFLDEDENESRAQSFHIILGNLICQLVLAGPGRADRERDRLFAAISKTFRFVKVEFLANAGSTALASDILRTPQAEAKKGWSGSWRKFPRACVNLPVPAGWNVSEEEGDVLFRRGYTEIRLLRDLEGHGEPGNWFASRMKRLQDSGDLLLSSESGELERGSYAGVLYEEKGVGRIWKTAAVARSLDLFLSDQQPLIWTLKAPEAGFPGQRSFFESLIAAANFIVPEEWETKLVEPWIDCTLRGPWQVKGPGLYVNIDHTPVLVHCSRESYKFQLKNIEPSIVESLRRGAGSIEGMLERIVKGLWKSYEALYYSLDGPIVSGNSTISIRATWLLGGGSLYGLFVRGVLPEETDQLARNLLAGFIGN